MGFGIFESEAILTLSEMEWNEEYYSFHKASGLSGFSAHVPEICSGDTGSRKEGFISAS